MNSCILHRCLLLFGTFIVMNGTSHRSRDQCNDRNFLRHGPNRMGHNGKIDQNHAFFFYAITQDCQMVFARADQLDQLGDALSVDTSLEWCLPELVQFHWLPFVEPKLLLLLKRTNQKICTLVVDFPAPDVLSGEKIFSYSLRVALNYAVCSFVANSSFVLEPELSFPDSLYSDVHYFVDPKTLDDTFWTIRQFKLDSRSYFQAIDTFVVRNLAKENEGPSKAKSPLQYSVSRESPKRKFLFALDTHRKRLFAVERRGRRRAFSTCPYDLLFRPHKVKVDVDQLFKDSNGDDPERQINSFSVDRNVAVFTEVHKTGRDAKPSTNIYLSKLTNHSEPPSQLNPPQTHCVLHLHYQARIGVISAGSLRQFRHQQLPSLDSVLKQKQQGDQQRKVNSLVIDWKLRKTTHKIQTSTAQSVPFWMRTSTTRTTTVTTSRLGQKQGTTTRISRERSPEAESKVDSDAEEDDQSEELLPIELGLIHEKVPVSSTAESIQEEDEGSEDDELSPLKSSPNHAGQKSSTGGSNCPRSSILLIILGIAIGVFLSVV